MKKRGAADVCADCGAPEPSWASINRGILVCDECCSVHRSMGRHISWVRPLRGEAWPPGLLRMMNACVAQNANAIWEHSLPDKKKPHPKDPLNRVKSDFVRAKHERLAYAFRPRRDDAVCGAAELSRQLHSSVRSASLDTSLRLLAQGADPGHLHPEKGTACLHVACRTGNASQAELLVAWGADPNAKDANGNTPSAAARLGGHPELADRMLELVHHVTDRLARHLRNDNSDRHFVSLENSAESHRMTDVAKTARGKLQLLPNHLFEELVMDIYDEIDRRECEAAWAAGAVGLERFGVAFLPANPSLSAPRNQGRQKLARLSASEMAALLRDILMDANRRQHIATLKPTPFAPGPQKDASKPGLMRHVLTDDEPLYDSVASDEDYAALLPRESTAGRAEIENRPSKADDPPVDGSPRRSVVVDPAETAKLHEIEALRERLAAKDLAIAELMTKLESLQGAVDRLTGENIMLKRTAENRNTTASNSPPTGNAEAEGKKDSFPLDNKLFDIPTIAKVNQRPTSMYETRERSKLNWPATKYRPNHDESFQENLCNGVTMNNVPISMPIPSEVHKYTEVVTKGIQELWGAMQDPVGQGHSFGLKANKIKQSVDHLISIFPKKSNDKISSALCQLSTSSKNLEEICTRWNIGSDELVSESDLTMDDIRAAAYELAKAAKILVSNFPLNTADCN